VELAALRLRCWPAAFCPAALLCAVARRQPNKAKPTKQQTPTTRNNSIQSGLGTGMTHTSECALRGRKMDDAAGLGREAKKGKKKGRGQEGGCDGGGQQLP
jgi:hypothetical protein